MAKRELFSQQPNLAERAMQLDLQQNVQSAQIMAEVRGTASLIFATSIAPYLQALIMEPALAECGGVPDPKILKSFAALSVKVAPYLAQAQGKVNIDESRHWGDLKVESEPDRPQSSILQSAG